MSRLFHLFVKYTTLHKNVERLEIYVVFFLQDSSEEAEISVHLVVIKEANVIPF